MKQRIPQNVSDRIKQAGALEQSLSRHADELVAAFTRAVSKDFAGLRKKVHSELADVVKQAADAYETAAQGVTAEMQDDAAPRAARDKAAKDLTQLINELKPSFSAVLGAESVVTYGFGGRTPPVPSDLAQYVSNAISLMKKLPAKKKNGVGLELDTAKVVKLLEPPYEKLQAALASVTGETEDLSDAYNARDEAQNHLDALISYARDIAVADYTLVGRQDLVNHLRVQLNGPASSTTGGAPSSETATAAPTPDASPAQSTPAANPASQPATSDQ